MEAAEKNSHDVVLEMEATDLSQNIGWNLPTDTEITVPSYLAEVQVSHKKITDRFVELLNLFEDYSRIMESEQAHYYPHPKLKRTQSEQFITAHTQDDCKLHSWSRLDRYRRFNGLINTSIVLLHYRLFSKVFPHLFLKIYV